MHACSVMSDSVTPWTLASQTPLLMGFRGKNTAVGSHFLLQVCCAVLSCFSPVQLCDTMDHNLPITSVHRILQESTLEWVVVPSARRFSQLKN